MSAVETVSIVAAAVTYPEARTVDDLWDNVLHQRAAFRPIPPERLPVADYAPRAGLPNDPDSFYVTTAALITDWAFDTNRFRVPATMYASADTAHWLALDTAARLLEHLGTPDGTGLPQDTTGVILGNSLTGEVSRAHAMRVRWPMVARVIRRASAEAGTPLTDDAVERIGATFRSAFVEPGDEMLAGSLANTIAGRICNYYDFHGTGYTVDGACSSSLLSVILARNALLDRELDFAIAGGVDVSLDPFELVGFSRLGALSRGDMRIYDQHPTGFLPGEGCGLVGLMRTSDAVRDGRTIIATIVGAGSSSDGAGGLTRPNAEGHYTAAIRAYRQAGVDPCDVTLFEGHGTGTPVGDPIELAVFQRLHGETKRRATIGSIKANIGHTKAAAGVAGLIKAATALHRGTLPPTTGCVTPHSSLRESTALRVRDEPAEWDGPAYAAVSAMGFGGINTHVVLAGQSHRTAASIPLTTRTGRTDVWAFTAADEPQLATLLTQALITIVNGSDGQAHDWSLTYAAAANPRSAFRVAFAAASRAEAVRALQTARTLLADTARERRRSAPDVSLLRTRDAVTVGVGPSATVGLLFPGQAAPLTRPGTVFESLAGPGPWTAAAADGIRVAASADPSAPNTREAQPSIVGGSLLGIALLDRLGVHPVAAIGHSLGEITALGWAGALSPADCVALAVRRGESMATYGRARTGMMSVAADGDITQGLLDAVNADRDPSVRVVVSGFNGPAQTTIAGGVDQLEEVAELARRRMVGSVRLAVSHGFHSSAMEPVVPRLRKVMDDIAWASPTKTVVSTVTGDSMGSLDTASISEQLLTQLTAPVRFVQAITELGKQCDLLVECGPGAILTGLARQTVDIPAVTLDVGGRMSNTAAAVAALAAAGAVQTLTPWVQARSGRPVTTSTPTFIVNPCGRAGDEPAPGEGRDHPPVTGAEPALGNGEPNSGREATEPVAVDLNPDADELDLDGILTAICRTVAEVSGLGLSDVAADQSFSRDLHLNSLQVGQIVARVTTLAGRANPEAPLSLVDATLAEAAETIDRLPREDETASTRLLGALPWFAQFTDQWVPITENPDASSHVTWTIDLDPAACERLGSDDGLIADVRGRREGADDRVIAAVRALTTASRAAAAVLVHDGADAAIARCVHAELGTPRVIVAVCTTEPIAAWLPTLPFGRQFADLLYESGRWYERVARRHTAAPNTLTLGSGDVCIVSGGLSGITAECATELAQVTGARLVFCGRTGPADPVVVNALDSMARAGLHATYAQADVTDLGSIRDLIAEASRAGNVTGLIHGAGINTPRRIAEASSESLAASSAVKADAVRAFLACWPQPPPRLLVTFGSIIGRAGLPGELEYALANERLRCLTEQFAKHAPEGATVRHLDWTVWSGVGMGVHLGVLDSLVRVGVAPLGPVEGRTLFMEALTTTGPPTRLLTGRFPRQDTVQLDQPVHEPARFCENVIASTPGVEAVADAELAAVTDRALADHRIDGTAVLPAVMELEAIAQTAHLAAPDHEWRTFTHVTLPRPVVVGAEGRVTIRTSVARRHETRFAAAVRCDTDGYAGDTLTADVHATADDPPRLVEPLLGVPGQGASLPPALTHLYGPLFFHGPAFQRVCALHVVGASRCTFDVIARRENWFSPFLPPTLRLGDPGLLDATIHGLQVCYPNRQLLPVALDRLHVFRSLDEGVVRVEAVEREPYAGGDELVFDVTASDADGTVLTWEGLRLRRVGPLDGQDADPMLVGAYLARKARAAGFPDVDVVAVPATGDVADLAEGALGRPVWHTPAGRLETAGGGVATSVAGSVRVLASSPTARVGVDLTPLRGDRPSLGAMDAAAAAMIGDDGPPMVWAVREAMVKAGAVGDLTFIGGSGAERVARGGTGTAVTVAASGMIAALYIDDSPST